MSATNRIPTDALKAARKDPRIVKIVAYTDGWVSNSYRWPAFGLLHYWQRPTSDRKPRRRWTHAVGEYDRKRPFGRGPHWVAFSSAGGRLASG